MNAILPHRVRVELPSASPRLYLELTTFRRAIEQRVMEIPAIDRLAARQAAPFRQGRVAEFISTHLVHQVAVQAGEAAREGRLLVAPVIDGDEYLLAQCFTYLAEQADWLSLPGICEALGVPEPSIEAKALRRLALEEGSGRLTRAMMLAG